MRITSLLILIIFVLKCLVMAESELILRISLLQGTVGVREIALRLALGSALDPQQGGKMMK